MATHAMPHVIFNCESHLQTRLGLRLAKKEQGGGGEVPPFGPPSRWGLLRRLTSPSIVRTVSALSTPVGSYEFTISTPSGVVRIVSPQQSERAWISTFRVSPPCRGRGHHRAQRRRGSRGQRVDIQSAGLFRGLKLTSLSAVRAELLWSVRPPFLRSRGWNGRLNRAIKQNFQ